MADKAVASLEVAQEAIELAMNAVGRACLEACRIRNVDSKDDPGMLMWAHGSTIDPRTVCQSWQDQGTGEAMTYKRKEVIGECTLLLGDCREILPTLGRVCHVITDPPYDKDAHAAGHRVLSIVGTKRRDTIAAPLSFEPMTDDCMETIAGYCAANCDGWALAFCQVEMVGKWRGFFEAAGARWSRGMVWVKPDSSPQLSGDRPAQGFESIALAWCGRGRSEWNGGGDAYSQPDMLVELAKAEKPEQLSLLGAAE